MFGYGQVDLPAKTEGTQTEAYVPEKVIIVCGVSLELQKDPLLLCSLSAVSYTHLTLPTILLV